jgi:hypothetical protein
MFPLRVASHSMLNYLVEVLFQGRVCRSRPEGTNHSQTKIDFRGGIPASISVMRPVMRGCFGLVEVPIKTDDCDLHPHSKEGIKLLESKRALRTGRQKVPYALRK